MIEDEEEDGSSWCDGMGTDWEMMSGCRGERWRRRWRWMSGCEPRGETEVIERCEARGRTKRGGVVVNGLEKRGER